MMQGMSTIASARKSCLWIDCDCKKCREYFDCTGCSINAKYATD